MEDLSVLVLSCDKYSNLLPYFSYLFDKYWGPKNEYKKYISTETTVLEHSNYIPILTNESNWTNSLLISLNKIPSRYVFLCLDDFFLIREFPSDSVKFALQTLKYSGYDKYVFHYPHEAFKNSLITTDFGVNIFKIKQYSEYTMTLQFSIWDVDFLKRCLKEGESPWQFEIEGTQRVNSTIEHKILMELIPYGYHREAMSRGNYTPEYYSILKSENLL